MKKTILLIIPFLVGLFLFVYSWIQSYPIAINSINDVLFNHVSTYYWIGLPILLASTFTLALSAKNDVSKCVLAVFLVLLMYSIPILYSSFPGSDVHYFQGLTEYSLSENTLAATSPPSYYYEYPSFFILGRISLIVANLNISNYEFLFYGVAIALLATSVYKYTQGSHKQSGLLAVTSFFIVMYYFINLQFAPFTLALTILFVALMLEATMSEGRTKSIAIIILFFGMVLTHSFVPLFFILYKIIQYLLTRKSGVLQFSLVTLTIYLLYQVAVASQTLTRSISGLIASYSEYTSFTQATTAPTSFPIDSFAQILSRTVTIATLAIIGIGFVTLLLRKKKKLRLTDKAVFLTGLAYTSIGLVIQILGSRAAPLAVIVACIGVSYLLETKLKNYVIAVTLIVVILFISFPIHSSFYDEQIFYQSAEEHSANLFVLSNYNWSNQTKILTHYRVETYLIAMKRSNVSFESDFTNPFPQPGNFSAVYYTIGLGKNLLKHNYTFDDLISNDDYDAVYDNGFSKLLINNNSTLLTPP